MARRFIKYNPAFLSQEELIRNFVVRQGDLELITRIIRDNITDSNQHILIIGPRGSGKTTLALRVAAEIENQAELRARWYPLTFSEESYEVVSVAEFWLESLFHLAEQTGEEKWKRTYAELKNETDDRRMGERALAQLLDFADAQGKRILLIVENLNMIFGDLVSDDDAWKMRHTLLHEPRIMLLATATNRFEGIDNSSQAMYEMFKIHELRRLDADECNAVWKLITGKRLIGEQIRPIEILTGGNPRLLTIIAGFSAHRSFGKLMEDLVDLIDDHTEYFKSHLDNLPATERKAYLALAELWDPSTARDIAKSARLEVNTTSSLLSRLVGRGAVLVAAQEKKTKWYMVAERMYNIYYLMRRRGKPADRVKAAVKFMSSMYDPESASRLITEEACKLAPELCHNHYLAYEITLKGVRDRQLVNKIIAHTPKSFLESPYLTDAIKNFTGTGRTDEADKSLGIEESADLKRAQKLMEQGHGFFKSGKYSQAIKKLDQIINKFSHSNTPLLLEQAAYALINKGVSLGRLDRSDEAIQAYDELVSLYKNRPEPLIAYQTAGALVNKGITLGKLNRPYEAIQTYDELVTLFKDWPVPQIAEQVAKGLFNKGVTLGELHLWDEAIQTYDDLVARYKDQPEPQIVEKVAKALLNKGVGLGELGKSEEEIHTYDELAASFKNHKEPQVANQVAGAMLNKGIRLGETGHSNDEIQTYDELVSLFRNQVEPTIAEKVAGALICKGNRLTKLNRAGEAIQIYDEIVTLFKNRSEPQIALFVADALGKKGVILEKVNRRDEAIQAFDAVVALFKDRPELEFAEKVAGALGAKGFILGELNRLGEAIQAYDTIVSLYRDQSEQQIVLLVASALVGKGAILFEIDRQDEAIQAYNEVVGLYKDRPESEIAEVVASAMASKGVIMCELDRQQEAEMVLLEAINFFPTFTLAHIQLVKLLLNIPGRQDEALRGATEIITMKPDDVSLLNALAWTFYQHGGTTFLNRAQTWAERAVAISPDASGCQHTLACILAALGNKGAIAPAKKYIQDAAFVERSIDDAIELFVELAAAGFSKEALTILVNSPPEKHLEPLVAGLRLYLGEDMKTAVEILEVAKDVVKRIEERRQRRSETHLSP